MQMFRSDRLPGGKIAKVLITLVFLIFLGWFLSSKVMEFTGYLSSNWQEINFAYHHPNVVKTIREDYASKSASLDSSYGVKQPTPEEKLINQLTTQLQSKP